MRKNRYSDEEVGNGISRFLEDFRTSFGTDAEYELAEPVLCIECFKLPAAYLDRCFACHAKGRLPA